MAKFFQYFSIYYTPIEQLLCVYISLKKNQILFHICWIQTTEQKEDSESMAQEHEIVSESWEMVIAY